MAHMSMNCNRNLHSRPALKSDMIMSHLAQLFSIIGKSPQETPQCPHMGSLLPRPSWKFKKPMSCHASSCIWAVRKYHDVIWCIMAHHWLPWCYSMNENDWEKHRKTWPYAVSRNKGKAALPTSAANAFTRCCEASVPGSCLLGKLGARSRDTEYIIGHSIACKVAQNVPGKKLLGDAFHCISTGFNVSAMRCNEQRQSIANKKSKAASFFEWLWDVFPASIPLLMHTWSHEFVGANLMFGAYIILLQPRLTNFCRS